MPCNNRVLSANNNTTTTTTNTIAAAVTATTVLVLAREETGIKVEVEVAVNLRQTVSQPVIRSH
jgi:hypothetical protein